MIQCNKCNDKQFITLYHNYPMYIGSISHTIQLWKPCECVWSKSDDTTYD